MVTVAEAAEALDLTVGAVNRRLRLGQMRGHKVNARLWLVPIEELERAKAQGRLRPGPKPGSPRPRSAGELLTETTEHLNLLDEERRQIRGEEPHTPTDDEEQSQ